MITFRGKTIQYHCDPCNTDFDITTLVEYLRQFDIWKGYEKVPDKMYSAWKILVLGSTEYAKGIGCRGCSNGHHDILKRAVDNYANNNYE